MPGGEGKQTLVETAISSALSAQQAHYSGIAGDYCAVIYDTQQMTRARQLPLPIWSVAPDGSQALAVNMQRLEAVTAGVARVQNQSGRCLLHALVRLHVLVLRLLETPAGEGSQASAATELNDAGLLAGDGLWVVDMFTDDAKLLVSLQLLFSTVGSGPGAARKDVLTGLEYHLPDPPPPDAASTCLHWLSNPQV